MVEVETTLQRIGFFTPSTRPERRESKLELRQTRFLREETPKIQGVTITRRTKGQTTSHKKPCHFTQSVSPEEQQMIRLGNVLGMDHSRNRVGIFPFGTGNVSSLASLGQFPPQRLQATFPAGMAGLQTPLNMLSDIATGEGNKRPATDMFGNPSAKRTKMAPMVHGNSLKNNPMLMKRLAAMSGGFPMPKWGMKKVPQQQRVENAETVQKEVLPRHGAFPMPGAKEQVTKKVSSSSLKSYKKLWDETDVDLREEVLARRLGRHDPAMPGR